MQGVNADVCHSLCMLVEAVAEGVSLHASSRRMCFCRRTSSSDTRAWNRLLTTYCAFACRLRTCSIATNIYKAFAHDIYSQVGASHGESLQGMLLLWWECAFPHTCKGRVVHSQVDGSGKRSCWFGRHAPHPKATLTGPLFPALNLLAFSKPPCPCPFVPLCPCHRTPAEIASVHELDRAASDCHQCCQLSARSSFACVHKQQHVLG